jgi:hypothetical protein
LRDIGPAEEALRGNFRDLNANMSSWNKEFFNGLRFFVFACAVVTVAPSSFFAATCSLGSLIRTMTLSSWDKRVASKFFAFSYICPYLLSL